MDNSLNMKIADSIIFYASCTRRCLERVVLRFKLTAKFILG
jgi:hypothetical protein